jgi:hypothetical protein
MYQLDTVGIEFETTAKLSPEFFKDELFAKYFKATHDASIESPIIYLRNNMYMLESENLPQIFRHLERGVSGIELVSTPLTFDKMEQAINLLTRRLCKFGAFDEEERAGIHIHCAYPISHKILISTIKLGLALESLIFHLGGMGYDFRGRVNNSIFCRPLSLFGPPVVKNTSGEWIQLLDINEVLKSEDIDSFWKYFGGIDVRNPPNRYHPVRYFYLNLFSAFLHSTLEFRIFNTTLNSDYILACIRFCQEFTNLAFQGKTPFDFVSSVYEPVMSSQELLDKFCSYTEIEPYWRKILFTILERTPKINIEPKFIQTHLRDYTTIDNVWKAKALDTNEFYPSGFIDIHNFNSGSPEEVGERRSRTISFSMDTVSSPQIENNTPPIISVSNTWFTGESTVESTVESIPSINRTNNDLSSAVEEYRSEVRNRELEITGLNYENNPPDENNS